MVHRINKIEEVLHCSLDDTEIMEQLEFAIKMKMYATLKTNVHRAQYFAKKK